MNTKPIAHVLVVAAVTAASACYAAGPVGLGDLKLGMTKSQVEALNGQVRLSSGLTEEVYEDDKPDPNSKILKGTLANPLTGESEVTLSFYYGKLIMIYLNLDDERQEKAASSLMSSKYGPPKILDQTTEEQCIYGNGANFRIKKGIFLRFWSQQSASLNVLGGSTVSTRIMSNTLFGCPANLRYSLGQRVIRVLSMHYGRNPSFSNQNPF
jgi:hypothetical protein